MLFELEAEQVIYLGPDDALDRLVFDWARRLVGSDPSEDGLWARAVQRCGAGSADAIDRFIGAARSGLTGATAAAVCVLKTAVCVSVSCSACRCGLKVRQQLMT